MVVSSTSTQPGSCFVLCAPPMLERQVRVVCGCAWCQACQCRHLPSLSAGSRVAAWDFCHRAPRREIVGYVPPACSWPGWLRPRSPLRCIQGPQPSLDSECARRFL
eukprot:3257558-Amphidinium_carterae.1